MSISIERYVDITSGTGVSGVAARTLGLRLVSPNDAVPAGVALTFSSANDVESFLGTESTEASFARKYFGFVSKQVTSPSSMSIVRINSTQLPATLFGLPITAGIAAFNAISSGSLDVVVDGSTVSLTGINLSSTSTFPAVATAVQTALRAASTSLSTANVAYNSAQRSFSIVGSATAIPAIDSITVSPGPLANLMGLSGGLVQPLSPPVTPVEAISNSAAANNNFGSFAYVDRLNPVQAAAVAEWNAGQGNKFMFCTHAESSSAGAISASVIGFGGTAVTLVPGTGGSDHSEIIPAEILGATDYSRPAASQNYMYYRSDSRPPTVTSNAQADAMDDIRVNYIGRTQTGGQQLAFYQRGVLMGGPSDATDMTVYAGEMWLKDSITSAVLSGFLNLPGIPANENGRVTLLGLIQGTIDQALINGVISVGKTLTAVQRAYISQVSGNSTAWRQVEGNGYWIDARIVQEVIAGVVNFTASYQLIYGKGDQIRKVIGSNILI